MHSIAAAMLSSPICSIVGGTSHEPFESEQPGTRHTSPMRSEGANRSIARSCTPTIT